MSRFVVRSLVDLARRRGETTGDRRAYVYLVDGDTEGVCLTYATLDRRARAIAAVLQDGAAPGTRALLLYPPGLDFVEAFLGCLYAGVVAVPAPAPHPVRPDRELPRLRAIARDAAVAAVLAPQGLERLAPVLGEERSPRATRWILTDRVGTEHADSWRDPEVGPDHLAFLQYTSGSTASPRGVMVTHRNVLGNLATIDALEGNDADSVSVSWLPAFHDMGLIEGILAPLFGGYPAYLMAPAAFLQHPARWLGAIARYRATNSGGPNFAYDLCVRKIPPAEREALELGSWRVAYNGAEPIWRDTLERFFRVFAVCGFRWEAFYPVYGLAEATLVVSSGGRADAPVFKTVDPDALAADRVREVPHGTAGAVSLVGCGPPAGETSVVVTHPEWRTRCAPGEVGELWVRGPSVARGYWRRPEETARTFGARLADDRAGPFLRTGDLGFVADGQIFVTGRLKDVIILRGRKHYPQDLELTAERCHPAVRPGCVAAFGVSGPDEEGVALVAEVDLRRLPGAIFRRSPGAPDGAGKAVLGAIRQAVAEEHGLQLVAVGLLQMGTLPKTSSGKLQRQACRMRFLTGALDVVTEWRRPNLRRPTGTSPAGVPG